MSLRRWPSFGVTSWCILAGPRHWDPAHTARSWSRAWFSHVKHLLFWLEEHLGLEGRIVDRLDLEDRFESWVTPTDALTAEVARDVTCR